MAGILGAGAVLFIGGFESLEAVGAGDEESLGPAPESRVMVLPAGPVAVRLDDAVVPLVLAPFGEV
mgnify:CR=1 FL=1|jgi:hypothetical protein